MDYTYEITPRPVALGDGWRLRLLEDGEEVGGGVFPVDVGNPQEGVTWWNALQERERAHWLDVAGSAVPAEAWAAWLSVEAYNDAEETASDWLSTRY